jgi:hypothetical protein
MTVLAGNSPEDQSGVFYRSCHWTDGVLVLTDGDDEVARRQSDGRLDADKPALFTGAGDTPGRLLVALGIFQMWLE